MALEADETSGELESTLARGISHEMVRLYSEYYGHQRTTARTYINENIVLVMLQSSVTADEIERFAKGLGKGVIDQRVAFQKGEEDAFTISIERLTGRKVVAFLSANEESLDFAAEMFVLDAPPDVAAKGA